MNCYECGTPTIEKKATLEAPFRYDLSGLNDIYLAGIVVKHCPACKTDSPVIPRIEELHSAIAGRLIEQEDRLKGAEVRYLRKWVGISGKEFAAMLCVDVSHLSRVENGKAKHLGPSVDKLARAIVSAAGKSEYTRNILMHIAKKRMEEGRASKTGIKKAPVFRLVKNRWDTAA